MRNNSQSCMTFGSSALKPEYVRPYLRVIDGQVPFQADSREGISIRSFSRAAGKAVRWNRDADPSTCVTPVLDVRQTLSCELGFMLVFAIVALIWAFAL